MAFLCEGKGARSQVLVLIRASNSELMAFLRLASQIAVSYVLGSLKVDKFKVKCLCAGDKRS